MQDLLKQVPGIKVAWVGVVRGAWLEWVGEKGGASRRWPNCSSWCRWNNPYVFPVPAYFDAVFVCDEGDQCYSARRH